MENHPQKLVAYFRNQKISMLNQMLERLEELVMLENILIVTIYQQFLLQTNIYNYYCLLRVWELFRYFQTHCLKLYHMF